MKTKLLDGSQQEMGLSEKQRVQTAPSAGSEKPNQAQEDAKMKVKDMYPLLRQRGRYERNIFELTGHF